jgi:hypothetical protein
VNGLPNTQHMTTTILKLISDKESTPWNQGLRSLKVQKIRDQLFT